MNIYLSHGKESGPNGTKLNYLATVAKEAGWRAQCIDYRGISNPHKRAEKLLNAVDPSEPFVLLGSSMGAYVSILAAQKCAPEGLFLLAPAVYLPGYELPPGRMPLLCKKISIVHGWQDDLVPHNLVSSFAETHDAQLHLLNDGHRLLESFSMLGLLLASFLSL